MPFKYISTRILIHKPLCQDLRRKFFFLGLVFMTGIGFLLSSTNANYLDVRVLKISDGDSFKVDILTHQPDSLFHKNIGVRIQGIDAPEIRGRCVREKKLALRARTQLQRLLSQQPVTLHNCQRGKYFRIVCTVRVGKMDAGKHMLALGLAAPYNGHSSRPNWCPL